VTSTLLKQTVTGECHTTTTTRKRVPSSLTLPGESRGVRAGCRGRGTSCPPLPTRRRSGTEGGAGVAPERWLWWKGRGKRCPEPAPGPPRDAQGWHRTGTTGNTTAPDPAALAFAERCCSRLTSQQDQSTGTLSGEHHADATAVHLISSCLFRCGWSCAVLGSRRERAAPSHRGRRESATREPVQPPSRRQNASGQHLGRFRGGNQDAQRRGAEGTGLAQPGEELVSGGAEGIPPSPTGVPEEDRARTLL